MDILADYSFLFYLFLMLLLFVFRKRKKVLAKTQDKSESDGEPLGKRVSWEELMRELKRQTELEGDNAPSDDTLAEVFPVQEISFDKTVSDDNKGTATNEVNLTVEVQDQKEDKKNVLLQDKRKFIVEGQENSTNSNTTWAFDSLDDVKRAFVYSEILKPKFND